VNEHTRSDEYRITVRGHLPSRWSAWFDGFAITTEPDGTTVISGVVGDQSALHGVLQKLRDLGIPLLEVIRIDPSTEHTNH
jgi:hypothetical protein